jgi:hypothetical protein
MPKNTLSLAFPTILATPHSSSSIISWRCISSSSSSSNFPPTITITIIIQALLLLLPLFQLIALGHLGRHLDHPRLLGNGTAVGGVGEELEEVREWGG